MSAIIIDGKQVANEILEEIKAKVSQMHKKPGLAVILVGSDPASRVYVTNKGKKSEEMGFKSLIINLPYETTKEELLEKIDELNQNDSINGILLQLPLPEHLNAFDFLDKIDLHKDVDGFNPTNVGNLFIGNEHVSPCTPKGIMRLLHKYNVKIDGAKVVIVGRSNIVGKPIAALLLREHATITIAHSKTKNLDKITQNADILISSVGRMNLITKDMVKKGAVVIDVGINRNESEKLVGDVDFTNVKEVAGHITPVPGGVGPMTIAMLMENTLELALKAQERAKAQKHD